MKMESIYRKYIYSISKLDSNDFAYFTSSKSTASLYEQLA